MPSLDELDDIPLNPRQSPTLPEIVAARYSRRGLLRRGVAAAFAGVALPLAPRLRGPLAEVEAVAGSTFRAIAHGVDDTHHVAPGYDAEVLIRWGDPVTPGAPRFDPDNPSPSAQTKQFGYNNDYIGCFPLSDESRALLCVNHEYTNSVMMFPRRLVARRRVDTAINRLLVDIEMAAHGVSIVHIEQAPDGYWKAAEGQLSRRITAATPMLISGPVRGHPRVRTKADRGGTTVLGTVNNCGGGMTPWGTYLTAEENFQSYFSGRLESGHPEARNYVRYGIPTNWYAWGEVHRRFNINREPNEANRFGWIVEIDPYDPTTTPIKRTALGRFKHEGSEVVLNHDGRVVVYMGDDQQFEYLYKFVSQERFCADAPEANRHLLDAGFLYVARLHASGRISWIPLVWQQGPLGPSHGFHSQADVLLETRHAADLVGATPLDRPEDVDPDPVSGRVYALLTSNRARRPEQTDAANRRGPNPFGHVLELTPEDGDHAAPSGRWDVLVDCGDPTDPTVAATWNSATNDNGWFAAPDGATVDSRGRVWVATDQGNAWPETGTADGVWTLETQGDLRGTGRMFFRAPVGAEVCSPRFTPDEKTLFVSVQHPGTDGTEHYAPFARRSTFDDPATRWPDFEMDTPPRPSVLAITKRNGGRVGS